MHLKMNWITNWIAVFFCLWIDLHTCTRIQMVPEEICKLPREWRGRWYRNVERPLGEVTIRESDIDGIGHCFSMHNQYYYIVRYPERNENMFKCLYVIQRGDNVLQYRESHAMSQPNFDALCRAIGVENIFYTLVRAEAHPELCPEALNGQFSMTYKNNTEIDCFSIKSRMTMCASGKHMQFQYGSCPLTQDEEYTVECLSSWKDSALFLYASISYGSNNNKPLPAPIHRCFIITENGPDVSMSVSVDTSCQPFTHLTLTQPIMTFNQESCSFPSWMQHSEWLDFSGESIYHVNGDELVAHKYKELEDTGRVTYRYSCLSTSMIHLAEITIQARTVHRCTSSFQCLKFKRLSDDIREFSQGFKTDTLHSNCEEAMSHKSNVHNKILLVKEDVNRVDECSLKGLYKTAISRSDPDKQCTISSLHVGCAVQTVLTYYAIDSSNQISPASFRCTAEWSENNTQYSVVLDAKFESHTCIVLHTDDSDNSVISVNDVCEHNKGNVCNVVEAITPCPSRSSNSQSDASLSSDIELTLQDDDIPPFPPHSHCLLIHNSGRYVLLLIVISYVFGRL